MPQTLKCLDATKPGTGPWRVVPDIARRGVRIKNTRSGYSHTIFYGTRTKRTLEEAEVQAIAMCAVLNLLKAKRP